MARRRRELPADLAHVLNRLKLAIQALGYSMRDVERRLRVSDGYLSRVFLGAIELKIEHILNIAKALGIPAAQRSLLKGNPPPAAEGRQPARPPRRSDVS